MINTEDDKNVQKLKLLNITGQHLKYTYNVIVLVAMIQFFQNTLSDFSTIIFYVAMIQLVFNIVTFTHAICFQKQFQRMEFLIVYSINFLSFLILLSYTSKEFVKLSQMNPLENLLMRGLIFLLLQREIDILLIIIFPLDIANRQVNLFTNNMVVFLLLSENQNCTEANLISLGIFISNLFCLIFSTLFSIIIYKNQGHDRQLRNFINFISLFFMISYIIQYLYDAFNYGEIQNLLSNSSCKNFKYIFMVYLCQSPLNFFASVFVVWQEIKHIKNDQMRLKLIEDNIYLRHQIDNQHFMIPGPYQLSGQNNQQTTYNKSLSKKCSTLRSQQSQGFNLQQSVILGNQSSIKESKYIKKVELDKPNDTDEHQSQRPQLQKLGTSQFGAAQFGMLHSWANVQNNNPFVVQQAESMMNMSDGKNSQNKQDQSNHSGEEKRDRINSESFHIANPMDNGSQLTVH